MPKIDEEPQELTTGDVVITSLRLYSTDHDRLSDLKEKVSPLFRTMTIQELIREAVHIGLPVVEARYRAALQGVKTAQKK